MAGKNDQFSVVDLATPNDSEDLAQPADGFALYEISLAELQDVTTVVIHDMTGNPKTLKLRTGVFHHIKAKRILATGTLANEVYVGWYK